MVSISSEINEIIGFIGSDSSQMFKQHFILKKVELARSVHVKSLEKLKECLVIEWIGPLRKTKLIQSKSKLLHIKSPGSVEVVFHESDFGLNVNCLLVPKIG